MKEPGGRELVAVGVDADGEADHVADGRVQAGGLRGRDRVRGGLGVDGARVEHLVGDPVPDAAEHGLVEEEGLHGGAGRGKEGGEGRDGGQGQVRVGPELADGCVAEGVGDEPDAGEAPRVGEGEADGGGGGLAAPRRRRRGG